MLVSADIYVRDVPGQLLVALEPMSIVNANIIGVVHSREQMFADRIAVKLTFDISPDKIEDLKKIWKSRDVIVMNINSAIDIRNIVFMIVGELDAMSIEMLINTMTEKFSIQSKYIKMSSDSQGRVTCMMSISMKDESEINTLNEMVKDYCSERDYVYIRGI